MDVDIIMNDIKIGDFVIINDADRPCARLIAQVYKVDGWLMKAKYLSKHTGTKKCWSRAGGTTLVSDFGVNIIFNENGTHYTADQVDESKAKYLDGRPREWQPEDTCSTQPLRKWKRKQLTC